MVCIAVCVPLGSFYFHKWGQDTSNNSYCIITISCILLTIISGIVIFKSIPGFISTISKKRRLRNHTSGDEWAKFISHSKLMKKHTREASEKVVPNLYQDSANTLGDADTLEDAEIFDNADNLIKEALESVDKLKRHFEHEKAANEQLCAVLIALTKDKGITIKLEPRANGDSIGDIQIGDVLIEGKLDLYSVTDTDRLIGQIDRYCRNTPHKIKVVIYGGISQKAKDAITSSPYYPTRVSLIYLPDPQRKRRGDASEF